MMLHRNKISDADLAFQRKLKKAVAAIRAEADGRTCGQCTNASLAHDGNGHCTVRENMDGNTLVIYRADAPACRDGFSP